MADQSTSRLSDAANNSFSAYLFWKLAGAFLLIGSMVVGGVWFVVSQSIDGLKVAIETQNGRIGAVEASVLAGRGELNGRFDSQTATIEGRFNSTDRRFDSLQSQNSILLSEVRVLGEKIDNLTDAVKKSGYMVPTMPSDGQGFSGIIYAYIPDGGSLTQQQKNKLALTAFRAALDRSPESPDFLTDFMLNSPRDWYGENIDNILISDWSDMLNGVSPTQMQTEVGSGDYGLGDRYQALASAAGFDAGFVPSAIVGLPPEVGQVFIVGRAAYCRPGCN
jgi:hypothetical protein